MNKYLKYSLYILWLAVSILWCLASFRILGFLFLACFFVILIVQLWKPAPRLVIALWVVFVISTLVPIDVSFIDYEGPPKVVPYAYGYPSDEMFLAAENEEIVLGGCMVPLLAPSMVLVW